MIKYKTKVYNEDNSIMVQHHKTIIINHNIKDKTITLDNGGYFSKTTKDRLNSYLNNFNYRVFQKNYKWFIQDNDKNIINYENNITIKV